MPEFISKLQYKNYEKGEFADEKARDVPEIVQQIKDFPWESERGADIQLTGPSVTIQNDNTEYIKLGLYFESVDEAFVIHYAFTPFRATIIAF